MNIRTSLLYGIAALQLMLRTLVIQQCALSVCVGQLQDTNIDYFIRT